MMPLQPLQTTIRKYIMPKPDINGVKRQFGDITKSERYLEGVIDRAYGRAMRGGLLGGMGGIAIQTFVDIRSRDLNPARIVVWGLIGMLVGGSVGFTFPISGPILAVDFLYKRM